MSDFFSREELLGGLPARQASMVLFAIKSRTAYLMAQSRQAAARFTPSKTAELRERDFLEALAQGRDLPLRPVIQDLERYAPEWAALVPDNPGVKAAIAHMLAKEYIFTYQHTPRLRQALSLEDAAVKEAYQRYYNQPLQSIYSPKIPLKERWRWLWAGLARWLEELPPFWTAFALTLTETVGASILALPIALAGVGPPAGVVLLLVFGLINILTIAGVVEAITRNGNMRYGQAFFGRLVGDYLGSLGTLILTVALLLLIFLVLIAFYAGVATTLAQASGVPAVVWAALLFLITFYFLRRESLDVTIASALVIGAVNIGLIIILSLLALPHLRLENLLYTPMTFAGGPSFGPNILELIFGVVLAAYFGHTSAGLMAKAVLRRDPGGGALLWGNVAAMAVAMGLYILWVVAVNGAIAPVVLAATSGTALIPLAAVVGPSVYVFGSIFVVLGMGMGTIQYSLALFHQVREWLPTRPRLMATSPTVTGLGQRAWDMALSKEGRFWIGVMPVALVFLPIVWLLLTQQESFTGPLAFVGVITVPVLGGIFPMLMLAASRRKGDYVPGSVWHFLGQPLVIASIYIIFLASLFLHGLIIWQNPLQRVSALVVGALMIGVIFIFSRRGAFARRAVVELRVDQISGGQAVFNIVVEGKWLPAEVCLSYQSDEQHLQAATGEVPNFYALRSIKFDLPAMPARELKVWLHQLTPEGDSEALPANVEIQWADQEQEFDLSSADGQVVLPINGEACQVGVTFGSKSVSDLLTSL